MKLERLNKSHLYHDSLGENTFHHQFMKQLSSTVFGCLASYFHNGIRTTSFYIHILEGLKKYEIGRNTI
jgi:hypothetical protein